jgi:hypothetical protein
VIRQGEEVVDVNLGDLVARADEVLALGDGVVDTKVRGDWGWSVDARMFAQFRTAALSFLAAVFGYSHPYYSDFNAKVDDTPLYKVETGIGILRAARDEVAGGWMRTTRGLLSAEIFADFLEMADHLIAEKYKDAAAVIAGSALEGHLRQLAIARGVEATVERGDDVLPKKADRLNADLGASDVYSKLEQKSITAWLDLRNKAAHGKYGEYDEGQVRLTVEGIRQFMTRVPV